MRTAENKNEREKMIKTLKMSSLLVETRLSLKIMTRKCVSYYVFQLLFYTIQKDERENCGY